MHFQIVSFFVCIAVAVAVPPALVDPLDVASIGYAAPIARTIAYAAPAPIAYSAPIAKTIAYAAPAPIAYAPPLAKTIAYAAPAPVAYAAPAPVAYAAPIAKTIAYAAPAPVLPAAPLGISRIGAPVLTSGLGYNSGIIGAYNLGYGVAKTYVPSVKSFYGGYATPVVGGYGVAPVYGLGYGADYGLLKKR